MSNDYNSPKASNGRGGPHPLAGVPVQVLETARDVMRLAEIDGDCASGMADPLADAVLIALRLAGYLDWESRPE